uniref:ATP-binding cassette domain-containing protein n=1 Tax=Salmonella enterica TaxID=28901 RepID=UPI00329767D0
LRNTTTLHLDSLTLNAGDSSGFVGANGSGKSALAGALAGEVRLLTGEAPCPFTRRADLCSEQLQKLVSDEWQR